MRLGQGVEWGLHCVTFLALLPEGAALPAARLAEFYAVPPAYLAKALQSLAREGVIESVPGRRGGYRLARRPDEVTLLDVVEAVEGAEPSFRCTEIRRKGPTRVPASLYAPVCGIAAVMHRADAAWRQELRSTTVADVVAVLGRAVPPEAATKAVAWLQEVLT